MKSALESGSVSSPSNAFSSPSWAVTSMHDEVGLGLGLVPEWFFFVALIRSGCQYAGAKKSRMSSTATGICWYQASGEVLKWGYDGNRVHGLMLDLVLDSGG
eukprot:1149402-Rhodomonas_salina.5